MERVEDHFDVHHRRKEDLEQRDGRCLKKYHERVLPLVDQLIELLVLDHDHDGHEQNDRNIDGKESRRDRADDRIVAKLVLHVENPSQPDRLSILIDALIRVREHGNEQVEQQYEVEQDEDDEVRLARVLFECLEILLAGERTEEVDEDVPHVEVVARELCAVEHSDHEESDDWEAEGEEELGEIVPEGDHHDDGRTDVLGPS